MRAGKEPFVSSLTDRPRSRTDRAMRAVSSWTRGSPPEMTTPEMRDLRRSRWARNSPKVDGNGSLDAAARLGSTRSAFWQYGHRKLQPGRKRTEASLPGKSMRLVFMKARPNERTPQLAAGYRSFCREWIVCGFMPC